MTDALLRARGVTKSFGPARVLDRVDIALRAGEVHVLAGENGAGKSTLLRILAGELQADAGEVHWREPRDVGRVAFVHQELSLIDSMSVLDNLFLGRELGRVWLQRREQRAAAARLLQQLGIEHIDLDAPIERLPLATRVLIEIAKALQRAPRVLLLDEPTSALARGEAEQLYGWIDALRQAGAAIVYITHRMEEIYRLADRITVLRDGAHICEASAASLPADALIRAMVGRDVRATFPTRGAVPHAATPALSVEGACASPFVDDVSFSVAPGEILGVAGLQGAGSFELLEALCGARRLDAGRVALHGADLARASPAHSARSGVRLVSADRKSSGLCLSLSIRENLTLSVLQRCARGGWLSRSREDAEVARALAALRIRCHEVEAPVESLSGGNQQKVVLGRAWLAEPRVLLLCEPTRGVDVGARADIYAQLDRWTQQGGAIVLASTDLAELLGLCDRVLVLHRGRATALLGRNGATPERVMQAALGAAA